MKTKHILWLLPLLLVGCGETDPSQLKEKLIGGPVEERVITVGVQHIDTVGGLVRNSYPGYLEEGNTVDISFKYGGTLQTLNVKEGSSVRKGQVLARVSSPQMESTQRSAQATLEQAQDAYDRLKKVHDNGSLPEIKWREMVANLEKAQAALDLANAMLANNTVTAPFDGTVTNLNAVKGESITPLKPIMRVISTEGLVVKISVPENEIAKVQIGDEAQILIPALPGMIAKVVLSADVDNGIVVPANAVLINNDGKFVWVAKDGRATRQNITISGYSGTGVVVSEGLHSGDIVIVEGYQKVSEGMKVECGMMNVE